MRRLFVSLVLLVAFVLVGCAPAVAPAPAATPEPEAEAPIATPQPEVEAPAATPVPEEPEAVELTGTISVAGSTTVQPLAEVLAEAFMAMHPGLDIIVSGGGSSVGVKSAGEATVDVGMVSREVKQEELDIFPQMQVIPIAYDGIAMIVHPEVPVDDLALEDVRAIFSGEITNWSAVGGPDQMIVVVSREEGSGTRSAFEEMVMGEGVLITAAAILQLSNGAVRTTVATTPHAIAYLSFGYLDDSVKAIAVDGVEPTAENAAVGTYPVVRPMNMATLGEPEGVVKAWLDFILGAEGQSLVAEENFIKVR